MPAETSIAPIRNGHHSAMNLTTPTKSSYGTNMRIPTNTKSSQSDFSIVKESNNSNSRLLQLAERSNTRKSGNSTHHLLSFRNTPSPTKPTTLQNSTPNTTSSTFARRNSTISTPSQGLAPRQAQTPMTMRQNPKLYTSFSSKSASKLTRAFIKSDPLKTNIEHLVCSRPPSSNSSNSNNSPNSNYNSNNEDKSKSEVENNNNGRGLSNFITPLKALHASFHDRTKLSHAFAPRSRLFSQRDKSVINTTNSNGHLRPPTKEKESVDSKRGSNMENKSPDFLEYYGNEERDSPNVIRNFGSQGSSTPDILENCLGIVEDSGYIILERGRRAQEELISRNSNNNNSKPNESKSGTCTSPKKPFLKDEIEVVAHLHSNYNPNPKDSDLNLKDTEEVVSGGNEVCKMKMSTATPMKISSSSAYRAQIITLKNQNPRPGGSNNCTSVPLTIPSTSMISKLSKTSKPQEGRTMTTCDARAAGDNTEAVSNGSNGSKDGLERILIKSQPQENKDPIITTTTTGSGSPTWFNPRNPYNSTTNLLCDKSVSEEDIPPPIPKRSNNTLIKPKLHSPIGITALPFTTENAKRYTNSEGKGMRTETSSHLYLGTGLSPMNQNLQNNHNDYNYRYNYHQVGKMNNSQKNERIDEAIEDEGANCINSFNGDNGDANLNKFKIDNNPEVKKASRKLSSRRNRNKFRNEKSLIHSLSFSGKSMKKEGCGYSRMEDFSRNRSRSLPKSFMSVRNGIMRNVLPSSWTGDEPLFHRLDERSSLEAESPNSQHSDPIKMRWQKSATPSNSTPVADGRPKSFDYSQRKAWIKYYRDMEVSSATSTNNSSGNKPPKAISKGSISHLHLLDSKEELIEGKEVHGHPNPNPDMGIPRRTPEALGLTPSLFQRFSKTFSLRFGSNANVNKVSQSQSGKKVKSSMSIGSSPDLHNRLDEGNSNGKMRKGKSKSVRGEKCQSGDSGIGMEEPHPPIGNNRLRRIRSEFIETPNLSSSQMHLENSSRASTGSSLTKMSLVEIPNHVWEEKEKQKHRAINQNQNQTNLRMVSTGSYEDILEAKLGDDDDGFSSGEDSQSSKNQMSESRKENPAYHQNYQNYHSLPHKSRKKLQNINISSHPVNLCPQGRSKSLEDEQQPPSPTVEDNSIRGKVIKEIVLTEQNYVKTLNDIVQGFLNPCRARKDLFSGEIVRNIFSNVEDILRLHARFLEAMKMRVNNETISNSNIGKIFTEWADHFDLYSEYCCNNPISMVTVRSLMQSQEYAEFFEACRRLQLMDKLPLHGFLLRPIQRICQYHLQLNELLKQTEESHEDYPTVVEAVETMKSVAMKINDTQRQFDSLQEIIRFQNSVEGWEGLDLINRNSTILQKGELVKLTLSKGSRGKEVYCVLLNKDLVFCKKDFIRKGGYVFDGRIDLEVGVWLNIDSNEEDDYFGMVHNSFRIYSPDLKTWILFTAPSPIEKRKWITSLEKTVEVKVADQKMCEMAKLITILSDDRPQSQKTPNSYSHSNSNSNTLPKSSKKSKGKNSSISTPSNGKIDAETMLIEVSKLKRPSYASQHSFQQKERASKFYV